MTILPALAIAISGFIYLSARRKFYAYIERTYPEEWAKASRNPMKMRLSTIRAANLEESMKRGALASVDDKRLKHYTRTTDILTLVVAAAIVAQLIYTLQK